MMKSLIDPVSTIELAESAAGHKVDAKSQKLIDAETRYLSAWRERHERPAPGGDNRTALCISGGGIRSASFSLGVMQALAHFDILKRFDYLSTVSGGGYIGTSLSWFLSREEDPQGSISTFDQFGTGPNDFPYGTEPPRPHGEKGGRRHLHKRDSVLQRQVLEYLRNHGSYLAPGQGIGVLSLVAVILRAMIVSLVVWFLIGTAALYPIVATEFQGWDFARTTQLGLWILGLLAIDFGIYAMATRLSGGTDFAYRIRRFHERMAAVLIMGAVSIVAIGLLPWVHGQLGHLAGIGSAITGTGAVSAIIYFLRSSRGETESKPRISIGTLAPIAAALMLYGILMEAYLFAQWIDRETGGGPGIDTVSDALLYDLAAHSYIWVPVLLVLVASFIGWIVNLNYISIHRYYRDRLMETFMPDVLRAVEGTTGPAKRANSFRLSALDSSRPKGPYHIINSNVILVGDDSRVRRVRGGDSFLLSPLYCGSNATGWRRTSDFMGNRLTLATAMA
ncbi:MAG: patatin-like phospholipase family protein, partial [Rhodothermia bacterium]